MQIGPVDVFKGHMKQMCVYQEIQRLFCMGNAVICGGRWKLQMHGTAEVLRRQTDAREVSAHVGRQGI